MKKLFLVLAAAFAMVACQTDLNEVNVAGGEVDVTFEVGTPTRAYSDGTTATRLQYAIYDENGDELTALTKTDATINITATVELKLVTGNTYTAIFWADNDAAPYTVDFGAKTMTVDYTGVACNDENLDAFYAIHPFTVKGAQTETIELRRPFAQLNIGTKDYEAAENAGYVPTQSSVVVKNVYSTLNLATGVVANEVEVNFATADIKKDETFPVTGYEYLAMNYLLVAAEKTVVDVEFTYTDGADAKTRTVGSVPVQRNYRTNIYGQLLTSDVEINVEIKPEYEDTAYDASLQYAAENGGVVKLSEDLVLENPIKVKAGKVMVIDLNGHTLSATSTQTGQNYNMLDVNNATLTVKNGNIVYEHKGENMGWSNSTNIFNVTNGGVLNLEGVTAKNLGGSDMGFIAHLNNWGEVTLNAENCVFESNYVAVRVFNSGPNMNNVTIKNSTLKGVSAAFWVHNYTVADFGTEAKAEAQKALLNLNIYNQGNTFSPDVNGIRYGFTNSIRSDAYGITKGVSEDGTVVTLGSVIENGLVRRGVAGAEENTTIKKVVVGEGITTLYDRTFRRYYALEEVVLPSTLTTIGAAGSGVFQSCSNLKNIVIPESVTVLGEGTFQECTSLTSINIPAGVTRIEKNVFRNTGLTSIEFHEGVTYFGNYAFRDCEELTSITIKAPSFTVESDTFLNAAGPFPAYIINVATDEMKAYLESRLSAHQKTFITVVGPTTVTTVDELNDALNSGEKTVILGADIENATIKLPAILNNVTLRAAAGVVLKNTTISAADGNAYHYENLTFDGITFDNSRIVLTGWRNGEEVIKNLTVTNCVFKNIDDTTNTAALHINKDASEAVENLTFTNNVINGAVGGSKSGVYAQVTGKVVFENNVINNVSFRPYVIQVTTDDGIADSFSVKGNTFSGSAVGRAQGLGNNAEGTDAVKLVVSGNIFKGITDAQQICYWNFNPATTTADLSKNYYSIDIEANPSRIYYNAAATSVEDLKAMGVYPYYTELNADGTINLNSLKQAE